MRIVMTGSSGFIGRHLLHLLGGHDVMCLSRRQHGPPAEPDAFSDVQIVKAELGEPETWLGHVKHFAPHCCIHLAWEGLPDYSPATCQRNLDIGIAFVEGLSRAGVANIVVAGSCWEYGAARGPMKESHTSVGCGLFADTKHALRAALDRLAQESGAAYRWARIFFAYGPGQRATSLIPQCRLAYGAGRLADIRQPRLAQDFIYVDDVARGLLALAEGDAASGVYNLGTGVPTVVGAVANEIATRFGLAAPYPNVDFDHGFWADTTKMTATTGWRAQTGLAAGIVRTIQVLEAA